MEAKLVGAWKMTGPLVVGIILHWHLNIGKKELEDSEMSLFWSSQRFSKHCSIYLSLEKDNTYVTEAPTAFHGKKLKFLSTMTYLWKWMITNNNVLAKRMNITENTRNLDFYKKIWQGSLLNKLMSIQWLLANSLDGLCLPLK